ncbi:MAG TPA: dihydrolipoyllysine-residue acetyltransferase [Solirubrobacteraceae bacterium]|jgi:pyruvate dehydrogenase E2 component (dihydrolipoamide acetyltransferase)|nr:dihydrolipoyllysine-residue acetyltransferase [Solirubrobacteraceae bacterium]
MSATAEELKVSVPDIGDFGEVPVIEILVAVGDTVAVEDPLITLESDKATMDVPSPAAGVVKAIHVKVGDNVAEGSLVLDLEAAAGDQAASAPVEAPVPTPAPDKEATETSPSAKSPAPEATPAAAPAVAPPPEAGGAGGGSGANGAATVYASPSVRRIARELGVDLHGVAGSGRKGRLTPDDVKSASRGGSSGAGVPTNGSMAGLGLAPWPVVDFEKFGPVERVERTRIQKISAPNLARNWVMIPHVTHNDEADITELEAWRKQLNAEQARDVKFTMVSFLVAASVATLREFPIFNSSLDGDQLVLRRYFNIGFAADTPNGLVVPVIKDADKKGLVEIARDLAELSGKAREGKLGPAEMSGGTFTISSLGGIGGTSFTPIINAPEVAILGVTRSSIKPVWDEAAGSFVPRMMLPLSLSYDHRVIDGAAAARFVAQLVKVLSDLRRALL